MPVYIEPKAAPTVIQARGEDPQLEVCCSDNTPTQVRQKTGSRILVTRSHRSKTWIYPRMLIGREYSSQVGGLGSFYVSKTNREEKV